jgi:formylmethanofuran dehydrogenase subunit A
VNLARRLCRRGGGVPARRGPESPRLRSGTFGTVPSTFTTGHLYSAGYTTVFDAAVPPWERQAHLELGDTPLRTRASMSSSAAMTVPAARSRRRRAPAHPGLGARAARLRAVVNPGGVDA